jgi:endonuclease/exonuclease/phosphatase family metal-dependent hydrolase
MLKLMTLNLWGYHDWDNRTENIVSLINKQNPDCIVLQEVLTNKSFSDFPSSDFIANHADYKYKVFAPTYARTNSKDREGNRTQRASYGQAFLSKHLIVSTESYFLQRYPDHDEDTTALFCSIEVDGSIVEICNVHFANTAKHSDLHLNELMDLIENRGSQPIILGDFNIYDLSTYKTSRLTSYILSTDVMAYTSMPGDNGTLDYIVVPKSKYKIKDIVCPKQYVSDHRALLANVELLHV